MKKEVILPNKKTFVVQLSDKVFTPTGTSDLIIDALNMKIEKPGLFLDLGCGCGIVGIAASLLGKAESCLYASDLSEAAAELVNRNCAEYDIEVDTRYGSVFDPWDGIKFDYISDDISGVAEAVAAISPWFENTSCASGSDGSDLTIEVIRKAPKYLNSGGTLFFPTLSFSNEAKIIAEARNCFENIELVNKKTWPLPREMAMHKDVLQDLKQNGDISYEERFGMILWSTSIYRVF
jgi:methylase of polypeptide subunit release factors